MRAKAEGVRAKISRTANPASDSGGRQEFVTYQRSPEEQIVIARSRATKQPSPPSLLRALARLQLLERPSRTLGDGKLDRRGALRAPRDDRSLEQEGR